MALIGYMTVAGADQGNIEGSVTQIDHEGEIELLSFEHQIEVPGAGGSSISAGAPVHGAIVLNKLVDKSTPKLMRAMEKREVLTDIVITWYQPTASGQAERFYQLQLHNALITRVRSWMPHQFETSQDNYRLMEDVAISYEKILWSWGLDGEVEFEAEARSGGAE
ncbi:type VI secretion system tube protein TssD [Oceanobacter mangrovi]|uniref:type VI secretion system tube protein TssD n=1 Tax=Oceanobacter mangrovi TaxID=2862510 RepID=UPI001C8EAE99|nr:type VI secretion system tube protein TssD [Oceanobacter mangrovi]